MWRLKKKKGRDHYNLKRKWNQVCVDTTTGLQVAASMLPSLFGLEKQPLSIRLTFVSCLNPIRFITNSALCALPDRICLQFLFDFVYGQYKNMPVSRRLRSRHEAKFANFDRHRSFPSEETVRHCADYLRMLSFVKALINVHLSSDSC